jgi:hypothetical protein
MDDQKICDIPFDCALKGLFKEIKYIFINCKESIVKRHGPQMSGPQVSVHECSVDVCKILVNVNESELCY